MRPYYEDERVTIYHGDALNVLRSLPDGSVDLVATDPPYFRVKDEEWDRAWASSREFLRWIGQLCREWRRVLRPSGSLYVFASPEMAHGVERIIRRHFNVLNSIRWEKDNGWHKKADKEALRSFLSPWEAVIFAEQRDREHETASLALHKEVFAPIGRVIAEKRIAAGLTRQEVDAACSPSRKPTGLCYRWEEGSCLPTLEQWVDLCRLCGDRRDHEALRRDHEALRRDHEALRRDYEALRRPFNVSDRNQWSDLWRFNTVAPYSGKHPCEKPLALMDHIVRASTRPGDVVLDTFCGSGATLEAACNSGRRAIGGDNDIRWCKASVQRLSQGVLNLEMESAA